MDHFFTLLLAASCLTAVGQVPDYVPVEGLQVWCDFDDNVNNGINNELIPTLTGNAAYTSNRFGQEGKSLSLDGINDEVKIDMSLSESLSVSLWFYYPSSLDFPVGTELLWQLKKTCSNGLGITAGLHNTQNFRLNVQGGGTGCPSDQVEYNFDTSFVALDAWHHLVVVRNNDGLISQWHNGQLTYMYEDELVVVSDNVPFLLGHWLDGSTNFYSNLSVDELGIWNRELSEAEVLDLFVDQPQIQGCTDSSACNFSSQANIDDGTCHFLCQYCIDGTIWSEELQGCVHGQSADINNDGCVQLNDLLDLLSAYGDCGAEESAWQCGDPLEYQGYDYATIQIGEQCWFAENLRSENYKNGELIPSGLEDTAWQETSVGAVSVFGEGASGCNHVSPNGDACDEVWSLTEYGRLYNWYAVNDTRGLCPNEWHVPQDVEWQTLEVALE